MLIVLCNEAVLAASEDGTIATICVMIGIVFGTVLAAGHLVSWNVEFSNDNGQKLWRGCSLCMLAAVVIVSCAMLNIVRRERSSTLKTAISITTAIVGAIAYVTARLILIYLIMRSFSDLPAEVYDEIDWVQYIPFFH